MVSVQNQLPRVERCGTDSRRSMISFPARVPQLSRKELALLANIGALNTLDGVEHRRGALTGKSNVPGSLEGPSSHAAKPMAPRRDEQLPVGSNESRRKACRGLRGQRCHDGQSHPMWFRRKELVHRQGYLRAVDRRRAVLMVHGGSGNGQGSPSSYQRPGTASGVVFIGVADETGDSQNFLLRLISLRGRTDVQSSRQSSSESRGQLQKEVADYSCHGPLPH